MISYLRQASLVFVWSDLQILHHLHILYMEKSACQIAINTLSNIFGTEYTFIFIIYLNGNRLHCLNIRKVIKVVFFNLLRAYIEFFFPLLYKIIALEASLQFLWLKGLQLHSPELPYLNCKHDSINCHCHIFW